MAKHNKLILGVILILLVLLVSQKAQKYLIEKNYYVYMHVPCTEETQMTCFELDGEVYVKLYKKASSVEACLENSSCDPLWCGEDEEDCAFVQCSEESIEEGETCVTDASAEEIDI